MQNIIKLLANEYHNPKINKIIGECENINCGNGAKIIYISGCGIIGLLTIRLCKVCNSYVCKFALAKKDVQIAKQ